MKDGLLKNTFKVTVLFLGITAVYYTIIFFLKLGVPIDLLMFCAIFYVLVTIGRSMLEKQKHGEIITLVFAIFFSGVWLIFPSLLIKDIVALVLASAVLFQIYEMKIPFRNVFLLALAIILYDVFMVFGTGAMLDLIGPLKANSTPLTISLSPEVTKYVGISLLGLGDIILPGSMFLSCVHIAGYHKKKILWILPLIGYFIGLLTTICIVNIYEFPQPATLYLYPGIYIGFVISLIYSRIPLKSVFSVPE